MTKRIIIMLGLGVLTFFVFLTVVLVLLINTPSGGDQIENPPASAFASPTVAIVPVLDLVTSIPTEACLPRPTGKIVFTCQLFQTQSQDQICLVNADGSGYRRLTTDDHARHFFPSPAPDGNSMVFSSNRTGSYEIYEQDFWGNLNQLTSNLGVSIAPAISPDGGLIVFARGDGVSTSAIWVMNRDGSNPHQIYGPPQGDGWDPTWSPDGRQILFASHVDQDEIQLFIMNSDGSEPRQVTTLDGVRGRNDWSPDGATLATYVGRPWEREIFLFTPDGTHLRQVTFGGNNLAPSFSPDGQWIVFTSYMDNYLDEQGCEVYVMKLDGSCLSRLTYNSYCDWQPRWGP